MLLLRSMQSLQYLGRCIADVLYPGTCAACGAFCDSSGPLCAECEPKLSAQEAAPACLHCARPLPMEGAPCPWCQGRGLYPFAQILRLGLFQDPLRKLIHQMKY